MNASDGFKKAVAPKRKTVREAVTEHGDSWRFYSGKEYSGDSDLVTFDARERLSMRMMEKGISPRIRPLDIPIELP